MSADAAVYVWFTHTIRGGMRLMATKGYKGPAIARLQWNHTLTLAEQSRLNAAVRLGAATAASEHATQ